jgi:hypothetical protein
VSIGSKDGIRKTRRSFDESNQSATTASSVNPDINARRAVSL